MAKTAFFGLGRKPFLRPHYPHMLAEDNEVWNKFLKNNIGRLQEVWYDVRVGKPVKLAADATPMELKIADGLTRKRIDVVALVGEEYWVIEVKPQASMLALGQVISYARLFANEYMISGRVIPVIVCNFIDEDLVDEFKEMGIMVLANK